MPTLSLSHTHTALPQAVYKRTVASRSLPLQLPALSPVPVRRMRPNEKGTFQISPKYPCGDRAGVLIARGCQTGFLIMLSPSGPRG